MKQRIYCLVAILICMCCLGGCGRKDNSADEGFKLYYLNKDENKLVPVGYDMKSDAQAEQITEVLEAVTKVSDKINCVNAMPEEVKLDKWEMNETNLTLSFSVEYLNMKKTREIMCRAALVLTLSQIEGIDYVTFNIGQEPLKDSAGEPVGMMKAGDFVDSSGSSINTYENVDVILYFGNESGDKLVEKNDNGIYSKNISKERYILDKLIKGPDKEGLVRTVPANTKIISVSTKDGICYVNLDSTFLTETVDVSDEVEIYSIVNSLCELTTVNKVQFSINGETDKKLHNTFSIDGTFSRNLDLLDNEEEED